MCEPLDFSTLKKKKKKEVLIKGEEQARHSRGRWSSAPTLLAHDRLKQASHLHTSIPRSNQQIGLCDCSRSHLPHVRARGLLALGEVQLVTQSLLPVQHCSSPAWLQQRGHPVHTDTNTASFYILLALFPSPFSNEIFPYY